MTPGTALLLDAADAIEATRWLVLGGEADLVMGIVEADPGRTVFWQPSDVRAATAEQVPTTVQRDSPGTLPHAGEAVDVVVVPMPPDRDLTRWWLTVAAEWVGQGGFVLLAGANAEGIRTGLADASLLFGPPVEERYGRKQRLGLYAVETAPRLVAWPFTGGTPGPVVHWDDGGRDRSLVSQAGVFSSDRLDPGTRMLLDALPPTMTGAVLDVGCGVGVIGFTCAWRGAFRVDLVDANLLAVQAAERNLHLPGLENCRVFASDVYSAVGDERYDLIVSNPPFHRGKAIDHTVADRLMDDAPQHLTPGGQLLIVANAFLAVGRRLERIFRQVDTVTASRQYHVLAARDPR
jgi:16S rRNA (guanine1207-N2)-methyltransferase